jgi:hypothetical protein
VHPKVRSSPSSQRWGSTWAVLAQSELGRAVIVVVGPGTWEPSFAARANNIGFCPKLRAVIAAVRAFRLNSPQSLISPHERKLV